MKLDRDTFPVHAACPPAANFYLALYRALGAAIGVPAGAEASTGGGYCATSTAWEGGDRALPGGLRVHGTRRTSLGEEVLVSYALFDAQGEVLAWSNDLDTRWPGSPQRVMWRDAGGSPLALTASMKDALKKLKALTPRPKPIVAPFTASTQVMGVAVSSDGSRCYGTDYAGLLHAWELPSGRELFQARVGPARQWTHPLALSPDGSLAAAGRRKVTVIDARTGATRCTLAGPKKADTQGLAFSPQGDRVALAAGRNVMGADNGVSVWDAHTGARTHSTRLEVMAGAVAWEPDGAALVVGTDGPAGARRIELASGRETHRDEQKGFSFDGVVRSALGWCGVDLSGVVSVRDPATLRVVAQYRPPIRLAARVWIALGPDPSLLLVSSVSGREAALIRAADGALVRALPIPEFEGDIMGVDCCGSFAVAATGTRVTVWPLD